jgi:hypothetical protein
MRYDVGHTPDIDSVIAGGRAADMMGIRSLEEETGTIRIWTVGAGRAVGRTEEASP